MVPLVTSRLSNWRAGMLCQLHGTCILHVQVRTRAALALGDVWYDLTTYLHMITLDPQSFTNNGLLATSNQHSKSYASTSRHIGRARLEWALGSANAVKAKSNKMGA